MKLSTICIWGILSSMSLTSCWQKEEKESTNFAQHATTNNVIYLHNLATRGQDATTLFQSYLQSGNVVVDFYATWCNPCTIMGRTIDQVAAQFPSITFLKVDVDQFQSIAANIRSLPTLVFYKNGSQVTRVSGSKDKNSFITLLRQFYNTI